MSLVSTAKFDMILSRKAIKLVSPRPDYHSLLITYLYLHQDCKSEFYLQLLHYYFPDAKNSRVKFLVLKNMFLVRELVLVMSAIAYSEWRQGIDKT